MQIEHMSGCSISHPIKTLAGTYDFGQRLEDSMGNGRKSVVEYTIYGRIKYKL
ncbi:MAG: hypothetical protein ACYSTG_06510 [Planctomycetota bacterium]